MGAGGPIMPCVGAATLCGLLFPAAGIAADAGEFGAGAPGGTVVAPGGCAGLEGYLGASTVFG